MASPQLENGYIKIANEVLEAICRHPEIMRGALFPVIGVVWRKTWGWNKKEDAISISQFVEMTGYSKRAIIYAIQELEAKKVLKVRRGGVGLSKDTNIISFNKNYKEWVVQNSAPQVEKNRGSAKLRKKVVQNSVKNVQSFAHTKDTYTKEITKDITEQSSEITKKDMSFKNMRKYKEDGHWDEPAIDADTGDEVADEVETEKAAERELNAKIRHNLHLVEDLRGLPFGTGKDMAYHVKIYRELLKAGWSHESLITGFVELINSDYWKEKREVGEYPGMNTLQSLLRNKKPV